MSDNNKKIKLIRLNRANRARKKIRKFSDRPRLVVFRSAKHIYAQVIDDKEAKTMASSSTMVKECDKSLTGKDAAAWVGNAIAVKALEAGIKKVVFDKGRYLYHGRVKALADSARKAGLEF